MSASVHCDFCPNLLDLPCRQQADALPPGIPIGNPSPARKLLVFLIIPNRELHAVLRLSMTFDARVYIRNKAETLHKLDGKNCASSCSPQRKIFYFTLLRKGSWRMYCQALKLPFSMVPQLATAFLLEMPAKCWEGESIPWAGFCLRQLKAVLRQIDNLPC
jgi:hypothetical protein